MALRVGILGQTMFSLLFTLVIIRKVSRRASFTDVLSPACLCYCWTALSEGAHITAPPSVSPVAVPRVKEEWDRTPPLAMPFFLLFSPPLGWSIRRCRESYGSLDQSNYCWELPWRDEGRESRRLGGKWRRWGSVRVGISKVRLNHNTQRKCRSQCFNVNGKRKEGCSTVRSSIFEMIFAD